MVRKCSGASEVAVMDMATVGVRTRARALAVAAPTATNSSGGAAKRKRIGVRSHGLKFSENSTCTQVRSNVERRMKVVLPENSTSQTPLEDFRRCLSPRSNDETSVSCCSSYGSSEAEKDKLKFVDLQDESDEGDTSTSVFIRERREDTSSSEVGEESDGMESVAAKITKTKTLPRSKDDFQLPSDSDELDLFPKIEKPEIKKPTDAEIEEFFAAAEAENLHQLEHFQKKYNFDFVKEEPLEGRFEWHQLEREEKCKFKNRRNST